MPTWCWTAIMKEKKRKEKKRQEILDFTTSNDLICMINNWIKSCCLVTRRDAQIMTDIYGKHTSIVKGTSIRQQATHTQENPAPVPEHQLDTYREITLSITSMKKENLLKTIKTIVGQYAL
eukprot:jgi/Psemu1/6028/gm1.6028_g